MAKDPAFLFYPNDWLGGTMYLSRHLKGCYMDLLIAQFNIGPLSPETIKTVLGQDQATWTVLSSKFKQDSHGNFSNERLAAEIEKRKNFAESRRKNIQKRYDKSTSVDTSVVHMNLHMENENRNRNEDKKIESAERKKKPFAAPSVEDVIKYFVENKQPESEARKAHEHYRLADWHDTRGNKVKNWKQKMHTNWFNNQKSIYATNQAKPAGAKAGTVKNFDGVDYSKF